MDYVIDMLRNTYFPDHYWKELGHNLGLDKATLDDIEKEYRSIPEECFKKCMHTWLRGGGTGKQVKTWRTLANALDRMGQKKVADKIR